MKPVRIQRRRVKGWKLPPNTICVTRGTGFGNPFGIGFLMKMGRGDGRGGFMYLRCASQEYNDGTFVEVRDAEHAVELFREYRRRYPLHPADIEKLRGKNLACFCRLDQPCHADVLLELANP
jgi:hypothetical protein